MSFTSLHVIFNRRLTPEHVSSIPITFSIAFFRRKNTDSLLPSIYIVMTNQVTNQITIFFLLFFRKASPVSACKNITLKSGVHVYPPRCLISNQDYGSTCTFSCSSGYHLSGPASIRCGFWGSWSENISTVRCNGLY